MVRRSRRRGSWAAAANWAHYLIAVVPSCAVLAAVALAAAPGRARTWTLAPSATVAVALAGGGAIWLGGHHFRGDEVAVGHYVRDCARPGDTQYVLYARANVAYYTGLPSPYPYAWSLMVRAVPGARTQLRQVLRSRRRPTWVIAWQPSNRWNLDPTGSLDRLIAREYRQVATVHGHPVYLRRDARRDASHRALTARR